ncbi:putative phosphatase [Virgibacillus natechei]|uniref:Phosphatase n=1 Tax=Virgibacillus natechei TaxID=1216297 RepID=A0ABS4ILZ1_9BACI|nr:histidine phosphatase family protein [Virgibacillus natechei]MBP1971316.1 putative phosphatase [Virgibacillus natechei]UZD12949.1 histidine phosphatase family protein [Virgibacillus natechei]
MTTICLIRHGETDWNAIGKLQGSTNIPLNNKGIQQAEECGAFLIPSDYDVLIASPLKRAKRTAEIINSYLNLPLVEMEDFVERSFGDAEGMTVEERQTLYPNREFPNKEERQLFNNRVMAGIDKLAQTYSDQRILLVAHGAVINAILSTISKGEIGSRKTTLKNACISNINFHKEQWSVKNYNKIDHLTNYQHIK